MDIDNLSMDLFKFNHRTLALTNPKMEYKFFFPAGTIDHSICLVLSTTSGNTRKPHHGLIPWQEWGV
jgi:hypothetical protein